MKKKIKMDESLKVRTYKNYLVLKKNAIQLADGRWVSKRDTEIIARDEDTGAYLLKEDCVQIQRRSGERYYYAKSNPNVLRFFGDKNTFIHKLDSIEIVINRAGEKGYFRKGNAGYGYCVVRFQGSETWYKDGGLAEYHGWRNCGSCGEWTKKENPKTCPCYRHRRMSYHSFTRVDLSSGARFKFGMEIEKEDADVLQARSAKAFYEDTKWCMESDGSLNSSTGFECVSPVLNLFNDKQIAEHFIIAKDIINAKYSGNCGGHIHVSDRQRDPYELFDDCAGYFPLLYALYPKRATNSYSQQAPKDRLKSAHKQAVMCHSKTLEFRIFPSPKNIATQWWRICLLRIMVKHARRNVRDVVEDMLNVDSDLFKHLSTQYKSFQTYLPKLKLVIDKANSVDSANLNHNDYLSKEDAIKELLKFDQRQTLHNKEDDQVDTETEVPTELPVVVGHVDGFDELPSVHESVLQDETDWIMPRRSRSSSRLRNPSDVWG